MTATVTLSDTQPSPTVTTGSAFNITTNSALLSGTVDANWVSSTKAWFEYGETSGSYGNTTSTKTVGGNTVTVSIFINGISSDKTYYYRLVAQNNAGTVYGKEKTFATKSSSSVITPQISCGSYHSLALKHDGTVLACGYNQNGQLGDGTTTNRNFLGQINSISSVIAITAGGDHNLVLKSDGTVWAWGNNYDGRLGDGTTSNKYSPVQVSGLTNVIAVAGGIYHSLALKSDGTVWGWGYNGVGLLGNGNYTNSSIPVQVNNLDEIIAIAGGLYHSMALKLDGTVWAWGYNSYGQLGNGSPNGSTVPVQVSSLTNVTAIASGQEHSLALQSDGTVWTWGSNSYGQLGDSTTTNSTIPLQVSNLGDVVAVAAGQARSFALKSDGTVWAWGYNEYGGLGDGTYTQRTIPIQVTGLSDITAISNGGWSHSMALKSDGVVWAWGVNWYGQLGDRTTTNRATPVSVTNINLDTSATPTPTAIPTQTPEPTLPPLPTPIPTSTSSCTDLYEPNDSFNTAYGPLTSQNSYQGKICSPFDADYFKINVANPGFISLTLNIPPDKDYELFLYDSRQSFVESSTMSLGMPETILYFAGTTGTYYVQVIGFSGAFDENQAYTLSGTWEGMANATPTAISTQTPEPTPPPLPTPSGICEAESMEISTNRLVLRKGRSREVMVFVKGAGDCPVEGTMVLVKQPILKNNYITVSPSKQETDENGEATFTITGKRKSPSSASVIFRTGNLKKTLRVKVKK